LGWVVELTGELLVHNPLASKYIEEVWESVELVVMSRAESVQDVRRVDSGGGGRRRGERVVVVVVESVHGSCRSSLVN